MRSDMIVVSPVVWFLFVSLAARAPGLRPYSVRFTIHKRQNVHPSRPCAVQKIKFPRGQFILQTASVSRPVQKRDYVALSVIMMLPPENYAFYSSYNNINDQDIRACQATNR